MSYQNSNERLLAAQMAIENALSDADIKAELALFGYDEARLLAGKALSEEAKSLSRTQLVEYGEQYAASNDFYAKWEAAKTAYSRSLKVARIAFKDNSKAQSSLKLNGARKGSFYGWLNQAEDFYANLLANPDLTAVLAGYGYDEAKLQTEAALVATADAANNLQQTEIGEAQDATKARDAKLDELDDWVSDFRGIAEVALADRPQLLEKLAFGAVP